MLINLRMNILEQKLNKNNKLFFVIYYLYINMNCWFCYEFVTDYILLPEKNDVFEIPKNKNTY